MDTYPCPACGGVADETTGCRSCGRPHDPVAAALARVNQAMAGLEDETRRLAADQSHLTAQRAKLTTERAALTRAIAARLAAETAQGQRPTGDTATGVRLTTGTGTSAPKPTQPPRPRSGSAGATVPAAEAINPETSPRSAQNTLLTLGGVLLAIAAVVTAAYFYTSGQSGSRALVLGIATTLALGVPVVLARRTLTATAETIAAFGLLLVLLDGYTAYGADLGGVARVPPMLFAAILLALVAGVAAAYRLATHLRAPQFAALLAVQPLLPLLAVQFGLGRDGLALVFAVVAAQNLAAVVIFRRGIDAIRMLRLPSRLAATAPNPTGALWPRRLRELAWALFGVAIAAATATATLSLIQATTVRAAVQASGSLLLAAAVAVAGGRLTGRDTPRHIATGGAVLAILAAVSRVNALALPEYTLVLTAAVAASIAIAAVALPVEDRQGPQLGSLIGAVVVASVVTVSAVRTAVAAIGAAVTPEIWAADISDYAARVHVTSWQVPAAAVLIAILAAAATPPSWRVDAVVLGGSIVVIAATGTLSWWALPLLTAVASTAATGSALFAASGRSALIRAGAASLLLIYAVTTSLARAELTAAVCGVVALVCAAIAIIAIGQPQRFGPYANRIADFAGGAAAFTLPAATFAGLTGTPAMIPMTMLATAVAVAGTSLSQVAAGPPRTASAGGALAAATGCVLLSLQVDTAVLADTALAGLLLAAAIATASAPTTRSVPVAAGPATARSVPSTATESVDAVITDRRTTGARTPRRAGLAGRIDATTLSAALATAALIIAMARLLAVVAPGIGLVTTTAMVFVVALGVLALPVRWRRGPRLGCVAVGGSVGVLTAGIAVTQAIRTLALGTPWWTTDLSSWSERASSWSPYGWQVPASLLLCAAAAWALLPAPTGGEVGFVTLALAGLAAPAAAGWPWWSPTVITGGLALTAGVGAASLGRREASTPNSVHTDVTTIARRRLTAAAVLGLYAVASAAVSPGSTAAALAGVIAAGVAVATVAHARIVPPHLVPAMATGTALLAAPGAAAAIAVAAGASRIGVLGSALAIAAFGVLIVGALRAARLRWSSYAAAGVGAAALIIAAATLPDVRGLQVWTAAAALIAAAAAAVTLPAHAAPRDRRAAHAIIVVTSVPAAVLAAIGSAPAWLTALVGPYRTLHQIWQGYASAPLPADAGTAMVTLTLLTAVAGAVALTLGGERYVLAALLPPLAALALVTPTALGAPREIAVWVALAVALATGLGSAFTPPSVPAAARLLRRTAAVVCAVTGATGLAASLATPTTTLTALGVVVVAAGVAAGIGRDPAVRMVAWVVASVAAFAIPVTALLAAGAVLGRGSLGVLAVCAALVGIGWFVARVPGRRAEADVIEVCAGLGAGFALVLTTGVPRQAAAVLTVWGLLLGAAALRRDRSPTHRQWLIRAALAAEVGACWLLLYAIEVGLPEAYTLPFAAVALLAGALELRRRPDLSSWAAYGPALAGGFLPSLVLVLVGEEVVWRWVTLFVAAIATVIIGSWRRRLAPVVTGSAVAVAVALIEMVQLLLAGAIAGAILVAVAGVVLIVLGGVSEQHLRGALRKMS